MTGVFAIDVANPLFKEVESRGIKFLRKRYGYASVIDTRSARTYHDILIYPGQSQPHKLDFKADQHFAHTGRVAWESGLRFPDGSEKPGWGQKDLDLVFYVDPRTFQGVLVDAHVQRRLAQAALAGGLPEGWVSFSKLNPGRYAGEGLAVPLAALAREGGIIWTGQVSLP